MEETFNNVHESEVFLFFAFGIVALCSFVDVDFNFVDEEGAGEDECDYSTGKKCYNQL